MDQAWSERTNVSLRAGAEIYESDRADETAPYVEASLTYAVSRATTARFYAQAGFDAAELGSFDSRYSYRAGIVADHQFTSRVAGSAGLHYIHSDYEGNSTVDSGEQDEVNASVGLTYNFWNNLSLDANYSFTTISSDTELQRLRPPSCEPRTECHVLASTGCLPRRLGAWKAAAAAGCGFF